LAAAAFADVAVIERHGLAGQTGPNKPKRAGLAGRQQARNPGARTLTDASGLQYFINTDITFTTSSSASGAASEASYSGPVNATTSGGGVTASTLDDAFDGYHALCVSLIGATGPCQSGGGGGQGLGDHGPAPPYLMYNQNGPATLDGACSNRQLILPPQLLAGIQVQRKVFVPSTDTFIRWFDTFTNTTGSTQSVTAISSNNLGSDSNTEITATSSGDLTVTTADTWVATFQSYTGTTSPDVRLGHVLWGPGAPTTLANSTFVNGDDNPFWAYTFTLAPGETRAILNFATGQPSKAAAAAKAAELVGLPDPSIQCLSTVEQQQVTNFA